jgi:hypothetical protein
MLRVRQRVCDGAQRAQNLEYRRVSSWLLPLVGAWRQLVHAEVRDLAAPAKVFIMAQQGMFRQSNLVSLVESRYC